MLASLVILSILFIGVIIAVIIFMGPTDCSDCAMKEECRKFGKPMCKIH